MGDDKVEKIRKTSRNIEEPVPTRPQYCIISQTIQLSYRSLAFRFEYFARTISINNLPSAMKKKTQNEE